MADYQTDALFGDMPNYSAIDAQTMNSDAMHPEDWLRVMTDGIKANVANGISGMIRSAQADGQLPTNANGNDVHAQKQSNLMTLLIIGSVVLLAVKA